MPTALITGVTGQDGTYLSEFLLGKGYRVVGTVRNLNGRDFDGIGHIRETIEIVQDDLLNEASFEEILRRHRPDEIYNFAAHSFQATSFQQPIMRTEVIATGVTRILEGIRKRDIFCPAVNSSFLCRTSR